MTVDPAQLRTSVAKRLESGSSCFFVSSRHLAFKLGGPYYLSTVDADDEVVPGFQRYLIVLVSEHLKAKGMMTYAGILGGSI